MAERRMFAKSVIDSDLFIGMPASARLLYFDLAMRADDDGFVDAPKKIMRMTGAAEDDIKLLIAKSFVIPFDNGIVVIRHWKVHNYISKDRHKETLYVNEKSMLTTDITSAYVVDGSCTPCIQNVDKVSTQVRLGKSSVDKERQGKDISSPPAPKSALDNAIQDFKEHRKKLRKPMTDHAVDLLCKKLQTFAPDNEPAQIELINIAIEHGWQTVYKPDGNDRRFGAVAETETHPSDPNVNPFAKYLEDDR